MISESYEQFRIPATAGMALKKLPLTDLEKWVEFFLLISSEISERTRKTLTEVYFMVSISSSSSNKVPSIFFDVGKSEKAPCYSVLSEADQHRLANDILEIGKQVNAAGFKLYGRSTSEGKKPLELHMLAMGERGPEEAIEMPKFGVNGCPFHSKIDVNSSELVQRIVTLSGNVLLVSTKCQSHLLQCTRDEVVQFILGGEKLIAGDASSGSEVVQKWSGSVLSQVGTVGGQTVAHAHVHVTRGISPFVFEEDFSKMQIKVS